MSRPRSALLLFALLTLCPAAALARAPVSPATVQAAFRAYDDARRESGMLGVETLSRDCYRLALESQDLDKFDRCAAIDWFAHGIDAAVAEQLGAPTMEYFREEQLEERWVKTLQHIPGGMSAPEARIGQVIALGTEVLRLEVEAMSAE